MVAFKTLRERDEVRDEYLTRSEVARLLGVSPNTVARWARSGMITCQMTLGGHRRFERRVIEDLRRKMRESGSAAS
jgi:excisionase family DNA binding protein